MQLGTLITLKTVSLGFLLAVLAVFPAWGQEQTAPSRIPSHNPEWTDHSGSDPGLPGERPSTRGIREARPPDPMEDSVAKDLQRIVVLCATEPQSAEFDGAWSQYLEEHYEPDLDVDGLIEEVLLRAEAHVTFGDRRRGTRLPTSTDRDEIRLRMRKVADEVLARLR